jgi:hypothetical protein
MLHLPYTTMVLSFVVAGAMLVASPSWLLLAGTVVAYFLGLGVGAHFLDQVPGMGSRYVRHWPEWALWSGGLTAVGLAVAIGVVAALGFGRVPLLGFVAVEALCAVGYPLATWFGGVFHRDGVFVVGWGALPLLTSYYAQAGSLSLLAGLAAVAAGAVALAEIRLSRQSRKLRSEALLSGGVPAGPKSSRRTFPAYDRALKAITVGTPALAVALLAGRVLLGAG